MTTTDRPLVVSAVVADGVVGSFGLGVTTEIFGYDRTAMGLPRFDYALVTEVPGVVRTDTGLRRGARLPHGPPLGDRPHAHPDRRPRGRPGVGRRRRGSGCASRRPRVASNT